MEVNKIEEQIRKRIIEIDNYIDNAKWYLSDAEDELRKLEDELKEKDENTIKDINNLKRELKRDNLYTDELETFFEQYMKYYNK